MRDMMLRLNWVIMRITNMLLIETVDVSPTLNWPYQNRWGHWVWKVSESYPNDRSWPGMKPPAKYPNAFPVKENDQWYWAINKENKMKEVEGDLIALAEQGEFDVIVHGCNCFTTMGAGIAKQIREKYPDAYTADYLTEAGDYKKLGNYTAFDTGNFTIVNAYTQYGYNPATKPVDYNAIRAVFKRIATDFAGKRIGYPKIGAGLAGGDWNIISKIIDEELANEDHTLVVFKPNQVGDA